MDDLTQPQQQLLTEFALITGVELDDAEISQKAILLLSNHNYDLNNAVLAFFDHGLDAVEPVPSPPEEAFASGVDRNGAPDRFGSLVHRNLQDEFASDFHLPRLPKAPRIANNWQFELGIHLSHSVSEKTAENRPKRSPFLWIIFLIIPKAFSFLFSFLRFLLGSSSLYREPPRAFDYDKYDETHDLRQDLDKTDSFNLHTKNFNACHETSQKDYDFLFIVLVDDQSVGFAKQLLQSEQFSSYFHRENGTFKETQLYFGNVDRSPEAFEVAAAYKFRRCPYVMLIGNVSNNPGVMSSMSVMYKSNLFYEDDALVTKVLRNLHKCLTSYGPQLVTKRYDKQEIELSRLIKEQQDEAYLESLNQDKVKKEEKERKIKEDQLQREFQETRNGMLTHLIETKWFETQLEEAAPLELVRVSIKLPDGKRIIHKFLKSMPVSAVYLYVDTLLFVPAEECCAVELSVEEYCNKFEFGFELFKPFPRVVLPSSAESIEHFGELKSGDNILVERLAD